MILIVLYYVIRVRHSHIYPKINNRYCSPLLIVHTPLCGLAYLTGKRNVMIRVSSRCSGNLLFNFQLGGGECYGVQYESSYHSFRLHILLPEFLYLTSSSHVPKPRLHLRGMSASGHLAIRRELLTFVAWMNICTSSSTRLGDCKTEYRSNSA